jgi:hypothetical protein
MFAKIGTVHFISTIGPSVDRCVKINRIDREKARKPNSRNCHRNESGTAAGPEKYLHSNILNVILRQINYGSIR